MWEGNLPCCVVKKSLRSKQKHSLQALKIMLVFLKTHSALKIHKNITPR